VVVEDEVALLRAENEKLRSQLAEALQHNAELEQRISELEQRLGGPPSFIKSNRPKSKEPKQPRRKRDPQHNHGRPREMPTRTVQHTLDRCPQCRYHLKGDSLDYARQVIELPEPQPVEVIEHQVIKRYCPHCRRWQSPKLDLKGRVFGQGRIGVRLASVIGYLRQSLRMTVRHIQEYLETFHRFKVSIGEIVELSHGVREASNSALTDLKRQMQQSRILHADETGWREQGQNG
jgi:transposase